MNMYNIPAHKQSPHVVNTIIEIPKQTSAKYEFDPEITRLLQQCEIHLLPSLNPGIDQSEDSN